MIRQGQAVADPGASHEPVRADDLEAAAAVFTGVRPRLFGIAYRMLSSASEAEDLMQEVWLRWQTCDRGAVVNPAAFLATTTCRHRPGRRSRRCGRTPVTLMSADDDPGSARGRTDADLTAIEQRLRLAPSEVRRLREAV